MDQVCFSVWIPWFDNFLRMKNIKKPVVLVLLMDGCTSHINLDIVEKARSLDIILIKLPPNSTHLLQALDVGVFSPCKNQWVIVIRDWYRQTDNSIVSKKECFPGSSKQII